MSNQGKSSRNPAKPPLSPAEDNQWAFLAHCGGILGCIPSAVIYRLFATRGPFTAQESREALNFTLPPTVLAIVLYIVALLTSLVFPGVASVFQLLALIVWVFLTVFSVLAALAVNRGNPYRYRWNLRLLK